MTKQEAFDKAVRGLASQNWELSMRQGPDRGSSFCAYRGIGGRRCAIGWLIPDNEYHAGMEGEAVVSRALQAVPSLKPSPVEGLDWIDFILQLQLAHDDARSPHELQELLHALATEHDLTWPEGC